MSVASSTETFRNIAEATSLFDLTTVAYQAPLHPRVTAHFFLNHLSENCKAIVTRVPGKVTADSRTGLSQLEHATSG